MVHRIIWRVASSEALDFWAERLGAAGYESERDGDSLRFSDPEGLEHELVVADGRRPAADRRPSRGAGRVRAAGLRWRARVLRRPRAQRRAARARSSSSARATAGRRAATSRGGLWTYDEPPAERGIQGAGTVHHIAWASRDGRAPRLARAGDRRRRAPDAGDRPLLVPVDLLPRAERGAVRDRDAGPGFGVDEDPEHLGEKLILPPFLEDRREQIEAVLTPVTNPRVAPARSERRARPQDPRAGG